MNPKFAASFGLKESRGVRISEIIKEGPADQAGLREGDIILEADGNPIGKPDDLAQMIRMKGPGKDIRLHVWRGGKAFFVLAALGEFPQEEAPQYDKPSSPPAKSDNRFSLFGNSPKSIPVREREEAERQTKKETDKSSSENEKIKTPGGSGRKSDSEEMQKESAALSLEIHGISLKPSAVKAGGEFTLAVKFTATDPAVKAERVPVQFSYEIRRGTTLMRREKPINVKAYNGSPTQQLKKISTVKTLEKDIYKVHVSLQYRDMTKRDSADLTIQ